MPIGIPEAMKQEHEELHNELRRATKFSGAVGKAAKHVAEVLHPHFERENEIALPIIGIAKELAEDRTPSDSAKAIELYEKFRAEYEKMLQEHVEIVKALDVLERTAKKAKKTSVVEFTKKLKMHAKTEEDLTYPAVLMTGKILKQSIQEVNKNATPL